eukprot:CAMPEP_0179703932 /NCGR_PEP_ID=MMETSP0937-20121108/3057_1 /TAXON_ID=548131 ORGANISM="Ostreococcus mediterraneus, Strain clade-D-RCC2593" /NCGR_SAMPLE_ID=MMETSP0937 /ASSEMBLY_ACC=CAM_ASM_000575 /LENGTH=109 /DNA_ID=CAMNT_0021577131 /DNA_START=35 /DNA_END=364 /DNA_ORIENTATION=+
MAKGEPTRLYVRGLVLGFKRARMNQYNHTSLIKLEGVSDAPSTRFYAGKKLCYIYKAKTKKQGTNYRTMWGKVMRPHGTSGVVRAKFAKPLPSNAMGAKVRCMLYPSNI